MKLLHLLTLLYCVFFKQNLTVPQKLPVAYSNNVVSLHHSNPSAFCKPSVSVNCFNRRNIFKSKTKKPNAHNSPVFDNPEFGTLSDI